MKPVFSTISVGTAVIMAVAGLTVGIPAAQPAVAHAAAVSTITDAPVGEVEDLEVAANGTTYAVGSFTSAGAATGGWANVSGTTGLVDRTFPPVNKNVKAMAPDGSGGVFIGGDFTYVDGKARSGLAHVLADGTVDDGWTPSVGNSSVDAMVLVGSTLYIGGEFTSVNGSSRNRIAALNTDDTGTLQSWNPGADNGVYALVADDSAVYAAGAFTTIGAQSHNRLAAFDVNTRAVIGGWNPNANGTVTSVLPHGAVVYVGGDFTQVGGASRNRLAAVGSVAAGSGSATSWDPNVGAQVDGLSLDDTTIYAVGDFTTAGGLTRNRGASFRTDDTGTLLPWDPNFNDRVRALAVTSDGVYVGGAFTQVGGTSRLRLARTDKTTGALEGWNPSVGDQYAISSVEEVLPVNSGNTILVGGNFTHVNLVTRTRAASFGPNGLVTSWQPALNNSGRSISLVGNVGYVVGSFTSANGVMRNSAAAFRIDDTGSLTSWDPNLTGGFEGAWSMAVRGMTAYVVGNFTTVNGATTRNRAAAFRIDDTGTATAWNPDLDYYAFVITLDDTLAYIGGSFSTVGGTPRDFAAAVSLDGVGSLMPWDPQPNLAVRDIALREGTAYLVGAFTTIKGSTRRSAAAVTLDDTGALTSWDPNLTCSFCMQPPASVIELSGSTAYIGGEFNAVGGVSGAAGLVAVSTDDTGARLGTWAPVLTAMAAPRIQAIQVANGRVHVGGNYNSLVLNNRGYAGSIAAVLVPAPAIMTVTPTMGPTAGGTAVTIAGTSFVNGAVVTIGGAPCAVTSTTAASISCISPAGSAGAQDVVVTNPDGQAATLSGAFTYDSSPSPPIDPPGAPTAVSAVAGDAEVTIAWTAPADAGSYPVTNYQATSTQGSRTCLVSAVSTSCTVTALANGTSYSFRVRALSGAGWGPWSAPSASVTPVAPAIVITGARVNSRRVAATGRTFGLTGSAVVPWLRFSGQAHAVAWVPSPVGADGTFTWTRRTRRSVEVYFAQGTVTSNTISIPGAGRP